MSEVDSIRNELILTALRLQLCCEFHMCEGCAELIRKSINSSGMGGGGHANNGIHNVCVNRRGGPHFEFAIKKCRLVMLWVETLLVRLSFGSKFD